MEGDFDEDSTKFSGDVILQKEREEKRTSTIIWTAPTLTLTRN
jgi:hypothetical protein